VGSVASGRAGSGRADRRPSPSPSAAGRMPAGRRHEAPSVGRRHEAGGAGAGGLRRGGGGGGGGGRGAARGGGGGGGGRRPGRGAGGGGAGGGGGGGGGSDRRAVSDLHGLPAAEVIAPCFEWPGGPGSIRPGATRCDRPPKIRGSASRPS